MSKDQLQALIRLRIREAHEALREARLLFDANAWRGSINRAYYCMFYAALALLATKGMGTSRHRGVISLFDREFVKPGLLSAEFSRSFHRAFTRRSRSDYDERAEVDEQEASNGVSEATTFVAAVELYLRTQGFSSSQE